MSARNTVKSIQDLMRQDVGVDGDAQRLSQLCWMFFLKIIDDQDQELELTKDNYTSPIPAALQFDHVPRHEYENALSICFRSSASGTTATSAPAVTDAGTTNAKSSLATTCW